MMARVLGALRPTRETLDEAPGATLAAVGVSQGDGKPFFLLLLRLCLSSAYISSIYKHIYLLDMFISSNINLI